MKTRLINALLLAGFLGSLAAQTPGQTSPPRVERLSPRVSVIFAGFNGAITVFQSEKGPVIVDCAAADTAPAVREVIQTIDPRPPAAVILTHYHFDHVGGLAVLAAGAPVYAHQECFTSFRRAQKAGEDALAKAGRLVPYGEDMVIQLGDETVRLIHPAHAHTSGDTVVVFDKEKVIAAGDLFFNGVPPYIDVQDGADTGLWAETIDRLTAQFPGSKVVPGHGPLADTAAWSQFAGYLRALREEVAAAIKAGQTRDQAQASVDLSRFSSIQDMGNFLTKKANIGWVYDELKKQQ